MQTIPTHLFEIQLFLGWEEISFQKTNFGVFSAEGAGSTKIGFTMRIAEKSAGQPSIASQIRE